MMECSLIFIHVHTWDSIHIINGSSILSLVNKILPFYGSFIGMYVQYPNLINTC